MSAASYSYRSLLSLAWPVVVARSSQAIIGFCDALMIAPLGESALAAVTTGAMNTYAITILPMGVVFIVQSFAAQLFGQGRAEVAVRYAWYALTLSVATLVLAIVTIPAIGPTLALLDYTPEVHHLMSSYLRIRILSVGAAVGIEALGNWYGGLGNTKLHMRAGLVAMVFNIFLNWVFIYGNLGAPALGVEGAAIASVSATCIGFVVLAVAFGRGFGVTGSVRPRGLRAAELGRMLRFGLPNGLNWFLEFAAFLVFINVIVADLGTTALAAMMVVFNINSVSFMPAFGLTSAGAILSGQAIGRDERDNVALVVKRTVTVALVWQGTVGLAYVFFPSHLMRLFATSPDGAEGLVQVGAVLLAISAAWQLFDAVAMTYGETLRSAGDTAWTLWARLVIAWVIFTPGAYLWVSVLDGGHVAAMICVVGYLALLAMALLWRFRSGAWQRIDLTGAEPQLV